MNGNSSAATIARQTLEQPFPPEAIQTKPSAHGPLSYVATWRYIQRMNEAYSGSWSFEIAAHEVRDDVVLVVGKLITPDFIKMAFGSAVIAKKRDTNEVVDLGDSVKAAASDSLKKACSLAGLGLHLWADGAMDQPADSSASNGNGNGKSATAGSNGNGPAASTNGNGNGNGYAQTNGDNTDDKSRLSSKQLACILAVGREKGLGRDKLQSMVVERFGRKLEFLDRGAASSFISELTAA